MTSLAVMQRYADRCALKLGVDTSPVLRWADEQCRVPGKKTAHTHVDNSEGSMPRGTICLRRGLPGLEEWLVSWGLKNWHALIAHEVGHLKVKDHSSLGFARLMVTLGHADRLSKRLVLANKRHVHKYRMSYWDDEPRRTCTICDKRQVGTISWKDE